MCCVSRYVLISPPPEWCDQLRLKFLDGFDAFLDLLRCMQVTWTHSDPFTCSGPAFLSDFTCLGVCDRVWTLWYQVSQEKVSIHLPMCRLLAGNQAYAEEHPCCLLEASLRWPPPPDRAPPALPRALCTGACWDVEEERFLTYKPGTHSGLCCRFRSADGCSVVIPLTAGGILLQVGASMMDPNHFLMIVLSRFELFHIFSSVDIRKRYREANKVNVMFLASARWSPSMRSGEKSSTSSPSDPWLTVSWSKLCLRT
ncbi:hypothetical protein XENOCAPTIV_019046 [Xenoophorus captivus]|uniref:E3 ubiquitin-protein ligase n=1 Tax=Xenoophorus captivus TaxID=1517983 RepID=A0ABV0QSK3_9TELE